MFFYLSKILGFFLLPSNFLFCLALFCLLLAKTRFAQAGRTILTRTIIMLVIMAFSPLGHWLLLPLEARFSQPMDKEPFRAPYGIIVLGGSVNTVVSRARSSVAINESGERLIEAGYLARRFPEAKILFSGGSGQIIYNDMTEAAAVKPVFTQMGIAPNRIIYENRSKNTWQNALYTKKLLQSDSKRRWLLVTSAFHMSRSMGCFRKAGINVIPWPVDYRTRGTSDIYRFFSRASEGLKRVDIAAREWIGLLAYRLTGRTSSLFPR